MTPAQFYTHLVAAFERSAQSNRLTSGNSFTLAIAGYSALIRCTSPQLRLALRRPLAHLAVDESGSAPDVTIDLVDVSASAVNMPSLPWPPQRVSPEQDTVEYQAGPYLFTLHGDTLLTGANFEQSRTVGFVRDPGRWPLEHYQQAIFITLYQHLRRRSFHLIHASAIGQNGQALLFAGSSGAGKTTTMLTCVRAGMEFYCDDASLLLPARESGRPCRVVSLLGTLNVTGQTLAWFPEIAPHISQATNRYGKRLVILNEVYPDRIGLQGEVRAILVPEITGEPASRLEPASKVALLSDLLPFSLDLQDSAVARDHLNFLAGLIETTPSYRLKLGTRREELPGLLRQFLG